MAESDLGKRVLILGAGVNGAALARELLANGVSVCVVDKFDLAFGATSKSSRLIHGGLRYLEYGDVKLVRESLTERSHLLTLAPHLVHPLPLAIPVRRRWGGLLMAGAKFVGVGRRRGLRWLRFLTNRNSERGLWVVRFGLWFYDLFGKDPRIAKSSVQPVGAPGTPQVDPNQFRYLCTYTDGQMIFPERFVIELLNDAKRIADEQQLEFQVQTYAEWILQDDGVWVREYSLPPQENSITSFDPTAIVNATGAWGDLTLKRLRVDAPRMFGGTKGSHFITFDPEFRKAVGESGVYAEAADGRLVFVLPFMEGILVGTTDERFEKTPGEAVATENELEYLLELTNELFPQASLTRDDIEIHYSGIRPLPYVPKGNVSGVSRDHAIKFHEEAKIPTFTLVGGKLTSALAFAEDAARDVLQHFGHTSHINNTRERLLPGGTNYPDTPDELRQRLHEYAVRFDLSPKSLRTVWQLFGARTETILAERSDLSAGMIVGTDIPNGVVHWIIEHEWVTALQDLVERRLLLVYHPNLKRATLTHLAEVLAACGRLEHSMIEPAVEKCESQLLSKYGKKLD